MRDPDDGGLADRGVPIEHFLDLTRVDVVAAARRWDIIPAEVFAAVVMADSLVVALPDTHRLASRPAVPFAELSAEVFVSLPPHEGAVLPDRLRRLAHDNGFVAEVVQVAPDTQTALALVSAEVGCHLTLASVAHNATDPHVVFVPLTDDAPDVDLRAAWRRDGASPALRAVRDELLRLAGQRPDR